MSYKIPTKPKTDYTVELPIKVEPNLKKDLRELKGKINPETGEEVNVPELIRQGIREARDRAYKKLGLTKAS